MRFFGSQQNQISLSASFSDLSGILLPVIADLLFKQNITQENQLIASERHNHNFSGLQFQHYEYEEPFSCAQRGGTDIWRER
jgi:hypothetical protein